MNSNNPLNVTPGRSLVRCKNHPEWGTWGIRFERHGEWYEITGRGGTRVLHFGEAVQFWEVVTQG